jgi:hypothetical protein
LNCFFFGRDVRPSATKCEEEAWAKLFVVAKGKGMLTRIRNAPAT